MINLAWPAPEERSEIVTSYLRRLSESRLWKCELASGCPGRATALQTVYPRVAHQAGLGSQDAQHSREGPQTRLRCGQNRCSGHLSGRWASPNTERRARFCRRWRQLYPSIVRPLERDLPDLLAFFRFPKHLWRKLRITNIIERCFVEVRRRTRPIVCFVNVKSVDRIIYSIFLRFNLEWRTRTLRVFYTSGLTSPKRSTVWTSRA
jgi:hypothetical protein